MVEQGKLVTTPFATIAPIFLNSECGAIGLAFDPNFVDNGYVYVFVTVSATEQNIIRYTAVGNVGTEKTLIVGGLPTVGANHDGGALGFGPDGKLYWAIGDNGNRSGADQDLASLAAKVGRANRDGSVPSDNPFFDGAGPNNDYTWARGFRNPFTMQFQPATGQLWLNVVGAGIEQIFTPAAGDHGGWDNYGSNQPAVFLLPVISYYTDDAPIFTVSPTGAVRAGGVVTITTTKEHRLRPAPRSRSRVSRIRASTRQPSSPRRREPRSVLRNLVPMRRAAAALQPRTTSVVVLRAATSGIRARCRRAIGATSSSATTMLAR